MAVLLKEIKSLSADAASVLEGAGLQTDQELQTLSREDLNELFSGNEKFKLRRSIFEIIHKQKPVAVLLKELNGLIPPEALRVSLSSSSLPADYLNILKELNAQVANIQEFIDAHIKFLENLSKNPELQCGKGPANDALNQPEPVTVPMSNSESSESQAIQYKSVVHGQTFGADIQLLEKVKDQGPGQPQLQLTESEDPQVIIVFCPVVSRLEPDVKSAMSNVSRSIPVILVLMHYVRETKYTNENVYSGSHDVVLQVNISFHETKGGLLTCHQNDTAASRIHNKLLEHARVAVVRESRSGSHGKKGLPWSLWSKGD